VVATVAVFAVLATVGVYVAWNQLKHDLPLALPARACVVNGGGASTNVVTFDANAVSLDVVQIANAATIGAVGIRRGVPQRAIVVALATAWQESKLENLPTGDRDSVGLFQQRPSQGWGRPEQLANPRYAANAFYTTLLKVPGWQNMRVTDAAQAVQRSAHPEAYEKWTAKSEILAKALAGDATGAVACELSGVPASRGPAATDTLAASVKLDWGDIHPAKVADLMGLTLKARDSRAGWQYAHWLVAHAEDHGIKRVRFGDREWTAKSGAWEHVTDSSGVSGTALGQQVLAEVFAA
jgi:hypothetical protein